MGSEESESEEESEIEKLISEGDDSVSKNTSALVLSSDAAEVNAEVPDSVSGLRESGTANKSPPVKKVSSKILKRPTLKLNSHKTKESAASIG